MGLLNPHLDDAAFADVWTEQSVPGRAGSRRPAEAHLQECEECRGRYAAFSAWLETVRHDARSDAEEALTGERLATQQAQIARRLEALEQPARVIAFPRFTQPVSTQPADRRRWIAGAAAAGLVVGVGLGQLMSNREADPGQAARLPGQFQQMARGSVSAGESLVGVQAVSQVSDEAYLDDHEFVPPQARVPESLQYLNAITPSARDYDPR